MHDPININKQIAELEEKNRNNPVSMENFDYWRRNPVTKRFFRDLAILMHDLNTQPSADTVEALALHTAGRIAVNDLVELLNEWEPKELEGVFER
ncbi:MAG: hypothetical protein Unbinned6354contig1000_22 [Prokaryotic dsDNA virus sp.]|nr:hypothetical protein [Cytophagaceae bacterium]QDP54319.1 MAG: hypothetical protein Unbinned6354contig1000_22 [Prokaryotic dsDNA virus sp.]|tara:strand:+ start:7615 stop:7899 length:285 start_codon:yes stop_codon:yes gene_type:complete